MSDYWKIGDFAKLVYNKHFNTVDGWFKKLEDEGIHYVQRDPQGEKIYDELDLSIGKFIAEHRKEKWALPGIFAVLPKAFELRTAPAGEHETPAKQIDEKYIANIVNQQVQEQVKELIKHYDSQVQKQLESPEMKMKQRSERINDLLLYSKVRRRLEDEAAELWLQKPDLERTKKVGFFRKEEDILKRERFIRQYVDEHLDEELTKETELTMIK